jgi:endonuclease III
MERRRDRETERKRDGEKIASPSSVSSSRPPSVPPSLCPSISSSELHEKRRIVKYVTQNLEAAYGVPINERPYDPLSELILTILSQSTSDINSQRAFENLKRRFPDWESVCRARASSIAAAIKSGGLANAKSITIKSALNEIKKRRGKLDLSFLHTSSVDEGREFLTSLAGVGPKTAACVLLFACNKKIFPMDVHILRITKRIGVIPESFNDKLSHKRMEKLVPPKKHYSLHINLIRHGRQICRPQNPKCDKCPLIEHCNYGQSHL